MLKARRLGLSAQHRYSHLREFQFAGLWCLASYGFRARNN